ncbi:MAG TPA: hypothetical protein VFD94_10020 [Jatrophihabitans sp.]|nr:hypothetical protein [Jatrophihabitans sp.]
MTASAPDQDRPPVGSRSARHHLGPRSITLDTSTIAVTVLVAVQAVWLAVILGRGWYTEADLPNLGAATGQPLDWHYLSASVGGHFGAPGRLMYWLLNRLAPLNWQLTVLVRLVLQLVATLLLWRLLLRLVGRRPWLVVLLALYALNPILVPGLAWLTSGLGLAAGQVVVLLMLLAHVRYTRHGLLRHAVLTALLALAALSLADQTLSCFVLLPLLSLGFLHQGSLGQRLRQARDRWPGWLALVLAVGGFALVYLAGSYNTGTSRFGPSAGWSIIRTEWLDVIGPSVIGGPWRWAWNVNAYISYADPPTAAVLLGQLGLVALAVLSYRARGWRAVPALAIPVLVALSGVLVVGRARYDVLGTFVAPLLRYSFYLPLALPIGLALAFAPSLDELHARDEARVRALPPAQDESPAPADRAGTGQSDQGDQRELSRPLVALASVAVLMLSTWSSARFAARFWQNDGRRYVDNLVAGARAGGPELSVYDSDARPDVMAYVEPNHYVSDILRLARVPVHYNGPASNPVVADLDGRLRPSSFFRSADFATPSKPGCGVYVHGVGSWRLPLNRPLPAKDWFLRLELYQPRSNSFTVEVLDSAGRPLALTGGSAVSVTGQLAAVIRRIDFGTPATVLLRSSSAATNLCLAHSYVGVPLVKGQ